jgi:mRNA interferase MazF
VVASTKPSTIHRGDVWLAALDPTVGSEIQKTRPCVVVSPPELHDWLRTVIVAPMTSQGFPAPFRIPITFKRKNGLILLDQIRTLDKLRLINRLGEVPAATLDATLATLQDMFAP